MVPVSITYEIQWKSPLRIVFIAAIVVILLAVGCASYSPGEFDYSGPYPVIRYADGTVYELPSGNGYN